MEGEVKKVFDILLESIPTGVAICDADGALAFTGGPVIVYRRAGGVDGALDYVSANMLTRLGYHPQDFLTGKLNYFDLIHPEDRERWKVMRERVLFENLHTEDEYRIRRADGEYRWICDYAVAQRDETGALSGYHGYLFDITGHKTSEMVIAESEKKYRELVENANVIIMQLDAIGRLLFMNEFGLKFFEYELSDIINISLKDTILPHFGSTGHDLWSEFDDLFNNPAKYGRVIIENVKKGGRRVWIEWTNCLKRDPVTGETRLIAIGLDVTSRKRAEATLRFYNQRERRNKVLNDIIESRISQDEGVRLAEKEGIRLVPPLICCVINFNFFGDQFKFLAEDIDEWQAWMETAVDLINARHDGTAWLAGRDIAVLGNVPERSVRRNSVFAEKWAEQLEAIIKDVFRGVAYTIGVSTVQEEITALYRQACISVSFGPIFKTNQNIFHWRDLGVGQFIVEQANSHNSKMFIKEWLGPLCEKSTDRNAEWIQTLSEIITGDNVNAIASRLHIHPKTLAFRKRRIEKLLQRSLNDPETRLNVAVALKLIKLREKQNLS